MKTISTTAHFDKWLMKLKDRLGASIIMSRVGSYADAGTGDVKALGDRVSELRVHFGPGYRVYFTERGGVVILLLCGGDKGSQDRDIAMAKKLLNEAS